jgi:hypothetical protein
MAQSTPPKSECYEVHWNISPRWSSSSVHIDVVKIFSYRALLYICTRLFVQVNTVWVLTVSSAGSQLMAWRLGPHLEPVYIWVITAAAQIHIIVTRRSKAIHICELRYLSLASTMLYMYSERPMKTGKVDKIILNFIRQQNGFRLLMILLRAAAGRNTTIIAYSAHAYSNEQSNIFGKLL